MEPLTIALGLSRVIPSIIGLFKGKDAKDKAEQVIGIAKDVAGVDDPEAAVSAIERDPALAAQFKAKMLDHLIAMRELDLKEQAEHHRFTAEMEGTAKDLMAIPVLGHIMLFLRGAQRVIWGFGALWMTFMVLSGSWSFSMTVQGPAGDTLAVSDTQKMFLFICIDLLVLATLFGERALRNLLPIIFDKLLPFFTRK